MQYTLTYIRNNKQRIDTITTVENEPLIITAIRWLDMFCTDVERLFTLSDMEGNVIMTEENLF